MLPTHQLHILPTNQSAPSTIAIFTATAYYSQAFTCARNFTRHSPCIISIYTSITQQGTILGPLCNWEKWGLMKFNCPRSQSKCLALGLPNPKSGLCQPCHTLSKRWSKAALVPSKQTVSLYPSESPFLLFISSWARIHHPAGWATSLGDRGLAAETGSQSILLTRIVCDSCLSTTPRILVQDAWGRNSLGIITAGNWFWGACLVQSH